MAKKKRELTTRRMPSGAQQYTRGNTPTERLRTNSRAFDAALQSDPSGAARQITRAMADEFALENAARRTEDQTNREDSASRRKEGGAMKSKKSKAPTTSTRPTPNPRRSDPVSRGNAASRRQQSEQDDVLKNGGRGMKAGGKVKKMMNGGKCRGMGAATKGGNYSRG